MSSKAVNVSVLENIVYMLGNKLNRLGYLNNKCINTIFSDIHDVLFEDEECINHKKDIKCPEINIRVNEIPVTELIDTGSEVNGLSEEWYNRNKGELGRVEKLRLTNTNIKGAIGPKSQI